MKNLHIRSASGFSLIEVLISMVLLSVGLLGTAKLTTTSLKSTNNSLYRSQAVFLANEMLDRMRANIVVARANGYDISTGGSFTAASGTVANFDCTQWINEVADQLPGGEATTDVNNSGDVTIKIQWDGGASEFWTTSRL